MQIHTLNQKSQAAKQAITAAFKSCMKADTPGGMIGFTMYDPGNDKVMSAAYTANEIANAVEIAYCNQVADAAKEKMVLLKPLVEVASEKISIKNRAVDAGDQLIRKELELKQKYFTAGGGWAKTAISKEMKDGKAPADLLERLNQYPAKFNAMTAVINADPKYFISAEEKQAITDYNNQVHIANQYRKIAHELTGR